MQTLTLGPSGPTVPALGIGTWAWGDKLYWGYGQDYDESQLRDAFKTAVEAGVNFFDTAEIYGFGESERLIGRFAQELQQPVILATKYFPLPWRIWGSAVADALTASLRRLQVPTVDLYQVHWPFDFFMGQPTLMNALADEVQQGRIKSIGVSNYSAEQTQRAFDLLAQRGVPLAVNQVQYSLLARQIERNGLLETTKQLGVTILAYSPLAQGLLTGKYTPETYVQPQGARKIDPRFSREGLEKLAPKVNLLKEIGQTYERTPAQVALNWLMAQGGVIPIPGAKNASQVVQNAGALGWMLSEDERTAIAQVWQ
ncbi:MAG: aldo/keto reductase [Cyanobacteria bacterium J069]|nr:MAG: aldo/keto reductase [Cyanobacteria bacterium J069]